METIIAQLSQAKDFIDSQSAVLAPAVVDTCVASMGSALAHQITHLREVDMQAANKLNASIVSAFPNPVKATLASAVSSKTSECVNNLVATAGCMRKEPQSLKNPLGFWKDIDWQYVSDTNRTGSYTHLTLPTLIPL